MVRSPIVKQRVNLPFWLKKLALMLCVCVSVSSIYANPEGGVVTAGDATITQTATTTTINQTSDKAIINWNSFNIGANEATHFQQPNSNSITLNRINPDQGASQIYGQLTANGRIVLVNQAGIFFASGARVDVGGMIASTAGISDQNFLAGKLIFDQVSTQYRGSVINQGTIIAANNGLVALIGANVSNEGVIQANSGQVILASGNKFTVDLAGDGLINFVVDEESSASARDQNGNEMRDGVKNSGAIIANGGKILLTAKNAQSVVDNVINMGGIAQAQSVSQQNGEIILSGDPQSNVVVSGKIDASGTDVGETGGKVKVLGGHVKLAAQTEIDVSGYAGGGEVLVGGNYQGVGPELNALTALIESGAFINANALMNGDGGRVIIWSDGYTAFNGNITAQGGVLGGNGGFVETSGHEYLTVGDDAVVNTLAPNGITGKWLLDPANVTISTGANTNQTNISDVFTPNSGAATATINTTTLQNALANANVQIITTNNGTSGGSAGTISVNSGITWSSAYTLTLTAASTISINAAITNNGSTGGGLVLSGTGITLANSVTTSGAQSYTGGNVTLSTNSIVLTSNNGGAISFSGNINGARALTVNTTGSTTFGGLIGNTSIVSSLTIDAGGTTTLNGNVTTSGAQTYNDAVTLNANTTLTSSSSGAISLNSTVDGASTLTVNTAGVTTFGGAVGGTTPLTSVTTNSSGTTTIASNINTTGAQTYSDAVTLGGNSTLTSSGSGAIGFSSTVNGAYDLAVNTAGTTTFSNVVGGTAALASLTTDAGGTTILSGNVSTANAQTYNDAVTLNSNTISSSSNNAAITFNSTINGARTLTINTTGATIFGAAVGGTTALTSVTTNAGGSTTFTGNIRTTGAQTYNDAITLAANTGLTGGTLTTNSTINGAYDLGFFTLSTVNLAGAIGDITPLASLSVSATTTNLSGDVTTTGAQSYTYTLSVSGTRQLIASGLALEYVNVGNGSELILNSGGDYGIDSLTGSGALTKLDAGILSLYSNNSSYTGLMTINAGVLAVLADGALGGTGARTIINPNATLDLQADYTSQVGELTLNGGTFQVAAVPLYFGADIVLGADTSINNSALLTLTGIVSGNHQLTKSGAGTLELYRANTYSGGTVVNGGVVQVSNNSGLGTGSATVNSGATLSLNNVSITNALTLNGVGDTGAGALIVYNGSSNTVNSAITLAGDTLFGGGNGVPFTLGGSSTINGPYALTLGGQSNFILNGTVGGSNALTSLTTNSNATVTLGGNITTSGAQTYGHSVGLGANSVLASTGSGNIQFNSSVNGAYDLTVNTAGNTIFAVNVGSTTPLASLTTNAGGNTTIASNVTTSGAQTYNDAITLGATAVLTGSTLSIQDLNAAGYGLTISNSGASSINGVLSGTNSALTKSGSGTLTLNGINTYTGGTTISGGMLAVSADTGLGDLSNSVTFAGGTLQTTASFTSNRSLIRSNNNILINTDPGTTFTYTGSITPVAQQNSLIKSGTGTLILSGTYNNAWLVPAVVSAGILQLNSNQALGASSITVNSGAQLALNGVSISNALTLNGTGIGGTGALVTTGSTSNTVNSAVTLGSAATIGVVNAGDLLTFNNTINGAYGLTFSGSGGLALNGIIGGSSALTSLTSNTSGTTTLGANITTSGAQAYNNTVTLGGAITLTGNAISLSAITGAGYGLTISNSGASSISGIFSGTGSTLTKSGSGTLTLSGASTYTGGTTVNTGILQLSHNSALGTGAATINSGGELLLNGVLIANALNLSGTGVSNAGALATVDSMPNGVDGVITLNGATTIGVSTSSSLMLTSNATVNGAYDLTFLGGNNNTLSLYGAIGGSTAPTSLATSANGITILGASITTSGGQTYNNRVELNGATTLTGTTISLTTAITSHGLQSLTINNSGASSIAGDFGQGGQLTKSGSGILTLGVANTYDGGTTINAGIIQVNNNSALGTGAVTVNSGGELLLNGVSITNALNLSGTGVSSAGALATTGSTSNTVNAAITLNNATTIGVTNAGDTLTLGSSAAINGAYGLTFSGNGGLTLNGIIGGSSALTSLTTSSGGTTTLGANVTTSGSQTYNNAVTLGANRVLTSSGSGNINLASTVNGAYSLTVNTAGTTLFGGVVGGNVALTSLTTDAAGSTTTSGAITTSGAQTYNDAITNIGASGTTFNSTAGGAISLANANNNFTTSSVAPIRFSITGGTNNATVRNQSGLTFGTSNVSGVLSATTTGSGNAITQALGTTIAASSLGLSTNGGSISLTENNSVNTLAAIINNGSTSNTFSLRNNSNLVIGAVGSITGVTSPGSVTINNNNATITLSNAITAAGTGNTIALAAGAFINNAGSAALNAGSGNFQVWSTNPANNILGNLDYSFKQYNATYGVTSVAGTGSGFLYSVAPVITASLIGNVTKTYDGNAIATLTSSNYSNTGAIDGDTVTLNNPSVGAYDNASVGTNKNVSVTGIAISNAMNGNKNVYGYQLASSSANGPIGTITSSNNQNSSTNTNVNPVQSSAANVINVVYSVYFGPYSSATAFESIGTASATSIPIFPSVQPAFVQSSSPAPLVHVNVVPCSSGLCIQ